MSELVNGLENAREIQKTLAKNYDSEIEKVWMNELGILSSSTLGYLNKLNIVDNKVALLLLDLQLSCMKLGET